MIVVFQGLESADHRDTLLSAMSLIPEKIPVAVSVSYRQMKSRRLHHPYLDKLNEDFTVILEAGASTIPMTESQAMEEQEDYYEFAEGAAVRGVIQFDNSAVPMEERTLPPDPRYIPVLFDDEGQETLVKLLDAREQIAFSPRPDTTFPAILRRSGGLSIALGQPDLAEANKLGFAAAMTNAWLSPGKFGELIFWDGAKFHRSSSEDKKRMFNRYSTAIAKSGVDMGKVVAGDSKESVRLAAWSYLHWAANLSRKVSDTGTGSSIANSEGVETSSDMSVRNGVKRTRGQSPLPVFGTTTTEALEENENGAMTITSRTTLTGSSDTIRVCDTCFLSSTCPAFEAGSSCAFNFPVEVRTEAQMKALLNSMVELQATRVAFARYAEEVNGGLLDPAVGQEMDRLVRITERVRRQEERREKITLSMESESIGAAGSSGGVLSKIFGARAAAPMVDEPQEADALAARIVQGEISDQNTLEG